MSRYMSPLNFSLRPGPDPSARRDSFSFYNIEFHCFTFPTAKFGEVVDLYMSFSRIDIVLNKHYHLMQNKWIVCSGKGIFQTAVTQTAAAGWDRDKLK